ncbi:probable glutathione S-transferase parC [Macadamia integrifolia]|uniref:probable glutathione S-transferase parC n=1 Tax=Macadamia integrifolia TaxID=60698 RepID=UPI001C52A402|nr:probable glutathione S-transferase parC [Macadamia integrifolia]
MCEKMDVEVMVVDFWANGFGMRVRIALQEKGIHFEFKEEDLRNPQRSPLVLKMNPVQKSIPILIHKGSPICDSLAILEYIDETWNEGFPLFLPKDPYERAKARFWASFIDSKIFGSQTRFLKSKGEAKEAAKKDFLEELKQLEGELGDKTYFGGDVFGFLDIVFIPFSSMFYAYGRHGEFKMEAECPKLASWVKRCVERESVSKTLPDPIEMYELHKKWYGSE